MTPEDRLDELEEALEEHLEDVEDCEWQRAHGELTLTVLRDGAELDVEATLGATGQSS